MKHHVLSAGLALPLIMVVGLLPLISQAEVPQLINYQGRLTDSEGEIVPDGNYSVTFRIYNDPVGAAEHLWEEGQLVTVKDGLFAVILGAIEDFPADLFDGPNCWLAIQVGLDPEMTPRSRLTSVAYAVHSATADDADVATTSLDKTIDAGELTAGALDAERFSAYDDLVVESKVGDQSNQLAVGDHSHGSQHYRRLGFDDVGGESSSNTTEDWVQLGGTITVPPGAVESFINVVVRSAVTVRGPDNDVYYGLLDVRVGEPGSEASKETIELRYLQGDPGLLVFRDWRMVTTQTYYEPTESQRINGFNVQVYMRGYKQNTGDEVRVRLDRFDVFGY